LHRSRFFVALATAATVAAFTLGGAAVADQGGVPNQNATTGQNHRPVCPGPAAADTARCHAEVATDSQGRPLVTPAPAGYGPADLQSAYNVAGVNPPTTQTVAIVDAYNDPTAVADISTYRNQFGLGGCVTVAVIGCTFTNGATINKVNQSGVQGSYPRNNAGWAQEISLDLDMVSAVCPKCDILLVEASSASFGNLGTAVNYAAAHANAISNSYGGSEFSGETTLTYANYYKHPGIAITVSSGDSGYGVEFPAASQWVTAVGGTSLTRDTSTRGWTERAWSGAGSGCSAYVPKPSYQADTGCSHRTVADVSAVADPNTGVAVYDSTSSQGSSGWMVFGGTSVASPIIASVYALAGNAGSATIGTTGSAPWPYSYASALNLVTSGSNGSCSGSYLCTAGPGYDGPTGLGTPNGVGAF
jgi:subtilase family serine protease